MAEDMPALPAGVARELASLRFHWSDAYLIDVRHPSTWIARRLDNHERIEADSAEELRLKIHADYKRRRVDRL